jgi:hypothetical protein
MCYSICHKNYMISYMKLHDGKEITRRDYGSITDGLGIVVITGTQAEHAGVALN